MKSRTLRTALLSLACLLAACGSGNNKIGSTVKGTRIAVIEESHKIVADDGVKGAKPAFPPMVVNLSWPQAGYDAQHAMPYAELPTHPHVMWEESIGEGSDSDYKLLARPVMDQGLV